MDTKKFLIGTLAGGIVFFFLGFLFYGILLADFFLENGGSAEGVPKEELGFGPLILGNLAFAALLTYVFQRWTGIEGFAGGAKSGAVVSFLSVLGFDMIMLGTTNIMNMTAAFTDIIVFTVMGALAGGVIGMTTGKKEAAPATE